MINSLHLLKIVPKHKKKKFIHEIEIKTYPVVLLDSKSKITYYSQEFLRMLDQTENKKKKLLAMISNFRAESLKSTYESLMKVVSFEWNFITGKNKPITVECVCQAVKFAGTDTVYCIFFENPSSQNEELTTLRNEFFTKTGKNRSQSLSFLGKHSTIQNKNPENGNKKMIKTHSEQINFKHTNSKKKKKIVKSQSENINFSHTETQKEKKKIITSETKEIEIEEKHNKKGKVKGKKIIQKRKKEQNENEKEKDKDKDKEKEKEKDQENEQEKEKKKERKKEKKKEKNGIDQEKNAKDQKETKTEKNKKNKNADLNNIIDKNKKEIETFKKDQERVNEKDMYSNENESEKTTETGTTDNMDFDIGLNWNDLKIDGHENGYDEKDGGILFSQLNDPKKAFQNIFTNLLDKIDNDNDQKLKQEILYHSINMIQLFEILDQKINEKKKELKKKESKFIQKNRTKTEKLEKKIQKILKQTIELPNPEKENEKMISKIDQLKKILKQHQKISQEIEKEYHEN
ncbi:zinc finger ccch domain-containing protein [Anaeramoeba flamelloides]|uniref:Zinc finger ccch domain-containing protein n=1 Tax=Anaeramoeba flamelloides TaxID=1746091 RepID=A0AAV7YK18_9EUKA|nr:zinc finger ccch domain-containing protein [Anaeramoeba flamelloides]